MFLIPSLGFVVDLVWPRVEFPSILPPSLSTLSVCLTCAKIFQVVTISGKGALHLLKLFICKAADRQTARNGDGN